MQDYLYSAKGQCAESCGQIPFSDAWIPALFVDTTIYYVAMASAIVGFYRYIVEYLEMKDWRGKVMTDI